MRKGRVATGVLVALVVTMGTLAGAVPASGAAAPKPPPIKHVFVVNLENESYDVTFGPDSAAPYLSQTLVGQGALLSQYYGIGHVSLDTTNHYARANLETKRKALEQVAVPTTPGGQPSWKRDASLLAWLDTL